MGIGGTGVCLGTTDGGRACLGWMSVLVQVGSVVLVLAVVVAALLWDARRTPTPSEAASRANRHATLASVLGAVALVVLLTWVVGGVAVGALWRDGRVLATLPALAGLSLLAAQAVGQLTWPRPAGARREAELAPRTVQDVAPVVQRGLVLGWAGAVLVALLVFGLVADGPRTVVREAGRYTEAIGPYPGWYYGVPMALAVVVTVVATELVLRLITLRPAVAGVSAEWDLRLRRRSAGHVTRGVELVLAVTTAGVLVAAGRVHLTLGHDAVHLASGGYASPGSPVHLALGQVLLVLGVVVVLAGVLAVVLPARTRTGRPAALGAAVPS